MSKFVPQSVLDEEDGVILKLLSYRCCLPLPWFVFNLLDQLSFPCCSDKLENMVDWIGGSSRNSKLPDSMRVSLYVRTLYVLYSVLLPPSSTAQSRRSIKLSPHLHCLAALPLRTLRRYAGICIALLVVVSAYHFFRGEAIFPSLCIDLRVAQEGEFFGRCDIGHVLHVSLGEDDVDLF